MSLIILLFQFVSMSLLASNRNWYHAFTQTEQRAGNVRWKLEHAGLTGCVSQHPLVAPRKRKGLIAHAQ